MAIYRKDGGVLRVPGGGVGGTSYCCDCDYTVPGCCDWDNTKCVEATINLGPADAATWQDVFCLGSDPSPLVIECVHVGGGEWHGGVGVFWGTGVVDGVTVDYYRYVFVRITHTCTDGVHTTTYAVDYIHKYYSTPPSVDIDFCTTTSAAILEASGEGSVTNSETDEGAVITDELCTGALFTCTGSSTAELLYGDTCGTGLKLYLDFAQIDCTCP